MTTVNLTEAIQNVITELKKDGNEAMRKEVITLLKAGGKRGRPKKVYTEDELKEIEFRKANPGKRGRPAKVLSQEEFDVKVAELQDRLV